MASIAGGHHVVTAGSDHGAAAPGPLGAFSLYLIGHPQPLGSGPDTLLGGSHTTVAGAQSGGAATASGGLSSGSGGGQGGGFDSVTGLDHGLPMAGDPRPGSDQVMATQTHHGGDTTLHLADGSSLTMIGTTHIDSTLFH